MARQLENWEADFSQRRRGKGQNRIFEGQKAQELKMLYEAGATIIELGEKFSCPTSTIYNSLLRINGKIRLKQKIDDEESLIVRRLYKDGMSSKQLAELYDVHWSTILNTVRRAGGTMKPTLANLKGEDHYNWKGGTHVDDHGYIKVHLRANHPFRCMASKNGYVLEHRLVMATKYNRPLLSSESVHHKNRDIRDNREENLQLRQGQHGSGAVYICGDCGSDNIIPTEILDG